MTEQPQEWALLKGGRVWHWIKDAADSYFACGYWKSHDMTVGPDPLENHCPKCAMKYMRHYHARKTLEGL